MVRTESHSQYLTRWLAECGSARPLISSRGVSHILLLRVAAPRRYLALSFVHLAINNVVLLIEYCNIVDSAEVGSHSLTHS